MLKQNSIQIPKSDFRIRADIIIRSYVRMRIENRRLQRAYVEMILGPISENTPCRSDKNTNKPMQYLESTLAKKRKCLHSYSSMKQSFLFQCQASVDTPASPPMPLAQ